jgi:hypothetical protein
MPQTRILLAQPDYQVFKLPDPGPQTISIHLTRNLQLGLGFRRQFLNRNSDRTVFSDQTQGPVPHRADGPGHGVAADKLDGLFSCGGRRLNGGGFPDKEEQADHGQAGDFRLHGSTVPICTCYGKMEKRQMEKRHGLRAIRRCDH